MSYNFWHLKTEEIQQFNTGVFVELSRLRTTTREPFVSFWELILTWKHFHINLSGDRVVMDFSLLIMESLESHIILNKYSTGTWIWAWAFN